MTLAALAFAGLATGGCAQFGGGGGGLGRFAATDCGGCGAVETCGRCRLFDGGLRNRLFRNRAIDMGVPAMGVPVETLSPDAVLSPAPAPLLSPAPAVVPAPADDVPSLEVIPESESSAPASSPTSMNRKTLYEAYRPSGGTTLSRLDGASRPAASRYAGVPPAADDPLAELPPPSFDEPAPATDSAAPAASEDAANEAGPATPDAQAQITPEPAGTPPAPVPAIAVELPPRPDAAAAVSVAPGISRFKVVEPQLAGGSLPNEAGWAFLVEKGYRTVLDLREWKDVTQEQVAAVNSAGLRYVALPITPETIDRAHLDRFQEELTLAGSRPLYFFDNDGSRASVLWYVRQVAIEGIDPTEAARQAEEVGPKDARLWLAASAYLDSLKAVAPQGASDAAPAPAVAEPATAPDPAAAPTPTTPAPETAPGLEASSGPDAPLADSAKAPRDSAAWRPYAALLVSGLGVPLAYFGRSIFSFRGLRARASLPAPERRPLPLPPASDD